MQVKQFKIIVNDLREKPDEKRLNDFLRGAYYRDAQYSAVYTNRSEIFGMILVEYEEGTQSPEEVVQMKQFHLSIGDPERVQANHKRLNDFLGSHDVRDIKYAAACGEGFGRGMPTGLALVIYKPSED
jgi:hypothetical protein